MACGTTDQQRDGFALHHPVVHAFGKLPGRPGIPARIDCDPEVAGAATRQQGFTLTPLCNATRSARRRYLDQFKIDGRRHAARIFAPAPGDPVRHGAPDCDQSNLQVRMSSREANPDQTVPNDPESFRPRASRGYRTPVSGATLGERRHRSDPQAPILHPVGPPRQAEPASPVP